MKNILNNYFYIDIRSLKAFRLTLSLLFIYDIVIRVTDFTAHYTNTGVLPIKIFDDHYYNKWNWSLIYWFNNSGSTLIVFILVLVAAILMFFGYRVKLMQIICWIGVVSIQNRNPVIYQGGDDLLRMLLFWSIFLPLKPTNENIQSTKFNSLVTFIILCQVLFPFFFSAIFKGRYEWWDEGSAIYYALSLDQIARPIGLWIANHFSITIFLTRFVYAAELLIFPLFLFPFFREKIRVVIFIFLVGFNLGIVSTMMIGVFPICFLASSVLFIPTTIWDTISKTSVLLRIKSTRLFSLLTNGENYYSPKIYLLYVKQTLLGFLFATVILWNISALPFSVLSFPPALNSFMCFLKLNQSWGMFAPTVLKQDGWLIAQANLENGESIDLNAGDLKLTFDKPKYVLDRFKNDRWRKYTEQLFVEANSFLRPWYAAYLVSNWDKRQTFKGRKVKNITVYFMMELSMLNKKNQTIQKIILFDANSKELKMKYKL